MRGLIFLRDIVGFGGEAPGAFIVLAIAAFLVGVWTYAGKYLLPPRLDSPADSRRFQGADWDQNDPTLSASAPSDCDIYGALFVNVERRGEDFLWIPSRSTTTWANTAFSEFSPSGVLAFSPTQFAEMPSNSARRTRIAPA